MRPGSLSACGNSSRASGLPGAVLRTRAFTCETYAAVRNPSARADFALCLTATSVSLSRLDLLDRAFGIRRCCCDVRSHGSRVVYEAWRQITRIPARSAGSTGCGAGKDGLPGPRPSSWQAAVSAGPGNTPIHIATLTASRVASDSVMRRGLPPGESNSSWLQ